MLIRLFQQRPRYWFSVRNRHNIWLSRTDKLKQPDKLKLPKHRQLFFQIVEEGPKQGQALISEVYLSARQLIVLVLELGATPAVIRASTVDF